MIEELGVTIKGSAQIGQSKLFDPLELSLMPNSFNCLLGASGVGKSTILRLIAGLQTDANFDGTITTSDGASLEHRIGYMAQSGALFPWLNVVQNVQLGARLRGETADKAQALDLIKRVGLQDHTHKKPSQLSGGEQQRVALARTLMEDRPLILLDEPFSALDAKTRSEMQELAGEVLSGKTVLLVTHDPAEAARLGHYIHILRPSGLSAIDVPAKSPVRDIDDPDTLICQGQLYRLLREDAS